MKIIQIADSSKIPHRKILILLLCIAYLTTSTMQAQDTFRKGIRGFSYEMINSEAVIKEIDQNSVSNTVNFRPGDIIKSIDGKNIFGYESVTEILSQLPAHKKIDFRILRGEKTISIEVELPSIPKEEHEETKVEYGWLLHEGDQLRTIITSPKIAEYNRYPAILLVQWLSCGSIEIPGDPTDGMDYVIKSFAGNPNFVFYRIDKSGAGDSRGTPCNQLDARREISSYKKALSDLRQRRDVDPDQIYILGLSLGTSLAPLVGDQQVAGYIVSGGTNLTWFEHMLEFERNRLTLSGESGSMVNEKMRKFSEFYYHYLILKKTPQQIIDLFPEYHLIWYDEPKHQFGRSANYYQQLQELNFQEAWSKVHVPVLVLYGEFDWIMSLKDHQMIAELVNNEVKLIVLPKTSHLLTIHPSKLDAFQETQGEINIDVYQRMVKWLLNQIK